jgi:hypothetical protein
VDYKQLKITFKIAGGISGMKVSWQVTGIRKDPFANAHRIRVEEDKPAKERGYYYTYPELFMVSSQKRERDKPSASSFRRGRGGEEEARAAHK